MQYKKDAVRDKILDAARKEYLAHGFRGANISAIAEKAGVPVGNLYRYFDGKSGVLDAIVKPAYEALPKLFEQTRQVAILNSATLSQVMPLLVGRLLEFFDEYGDDVLILMDCCGGTRYEDFYKYLTGEIASVIKSKLYPEKPAVQEELLSEVIGRAFCGSLFDVVRMRLDSEEKQEMFEKLLKFYFFDVDNRK